MQWLTKTVQNHLFGNILNCLMTNPKQNANFAQFSWHIASNGTSSMRNHMKHKHITACMTLDKSCSCGAGPSGIGMLAAGPKKQATLAMFQRPQMSSNKRDQITNKTATFVCQGSPPHKSISICQGEGFTECCHELNPRYQVPCRATVTK